MLCLRVVHFLSQWSSSAFLVFSLQKQRGNRPLLVSADLSVGRHAEGRFQKPLLSQVEIELSLKKQEFWGPAISVPEKIKTADMPRLPLGRNFLVLVWTVNQESQETRRRDCKSLSCRSWWAREVKENTGGKAPRSVPSQLQGVERGRKGHWVLCCWPRQGVWDLSASPNHTISRSPAQVTSLLWSSVFLSAKWRRLDSIIPRSLYCSFINRGDLWEEERAASLTISSNHRWPGHWISQHAFGQGVEFPGMPVNRYLLLKEGIGERNRSWSNPSNSTWHHIHRDTLAETFLY